jgi:hypothetical protein
MKKNRERLPDDVLLNRAAKRTRLVGECHEWTFGLGRNGYGLFWDGQKSGPAHRVIYECLHGVRLTRWQFVCHSCDNPSCVNPAHLWVGSPKDNTKDMDQKGRRKITPKLRAVLANKDAKGDANNMARLSPADIDAILASSDTGAALAGRFNVTRNHIYKIRNGVRWPHKAAA